MRIFILSKSVIFFFFLFIYFFAVVGRIIFYTVPDFYDIEENNYFISNFTNFIKSLYSVVVTSFLLVGIQENIVFLLKDYKLLSLYW